jgi:septal ring factor EnvC (AmiA/AmiB activator)
MSSNRLSLKIDHDVAVQDVERIDKLISSLYGEIAQRERQIAALGKERTKLEIRIARLDAQLGKADESD